MSINMTGQTLLVKQGWPRDGSGQYVGSNPDGAVVVTNLGGNRYRITGGSFGTKPNGQTSKVYVDSDLGVNGFVSGLSRDTAWQSTPLGSVSTAQIATGSTQSIGFDLSDGGAMLAEHTLDTTPEKLFCYRHRYEDFDVTVDYARRTRITATTGSAPTAGLTITGTTSGATGIAQAVEFDGGTDYTILYEPTGGTINLPDGGGRVIFTSGETMTWAGGSATNDEGVGLLEGFNNKSFRCWRDRGEATQHNVIMGAGAGAPTSPTRGYASTTTEYASNSPTTPTDSTRTQQQDKEQWMGEIFFIQNSTLDTQDGLVEWWKKDARLFQGQNRSTQDTGSEGYVNEVIQWEVSNGCQPNSLAYISTLVIEDSWHFVLAWNSTRDDFVLLPVESWSDTEIVVVDTGRATWDRLDVHVDSLDATYTGVKA